LLKLTITSLSIFAGLVAAAPFATAQIPQANVYFGLGTATADSNGQAIDPLGTGIFSSTPKLNGLFADAGGSLMLTQHFGAGAQISWRAGEGSYAGLNYRPLFYDFNAIWQPVKTSRIVPELQAGLGGARFRFSANTQACDQLVGCSTVSLGSESSNHFTTHLAAAVRLYATHRVFVRPAVDVHWVNNNFQFGSNWVPQYSIGVGYSFGGE
jgi:hypothetical protein